MTHYSAAKADDAAAALAKAVKRVKPFLYEEQQKMTGRSEYEKAVIDLFNKLAIYERMTR